MATASGAQTPLTTRQMVALPPAQANHTARRDLLSVLEPVYDIDSGMMVSLHGIEFRSKPYGTRYPGLCRQDRLTLKYIPAGDGKGRDAPVQPYGFDSDAIYAAVRMPVDPPAGQARDDGVFQPVCNAPTLGSGTSWFVAPDDFAAAQGAHVLAAVIAQVRAGTLRPLACPDIFDPRKQTCEQVIAASGGLDKLDRIETCAPPPGTFCYRFDLDLNTEVTVKGGAADDALDPAAITSVEVSQYIIVT